MTAQNHNPFGLDRNLDNPTDRVSVRDDAYLSEDPKTWLRPGDSLMAGGVDWAWCYVWFKEAKGFPGYIMGSNGFIWSCVRKWRRNGGMIRCKTMVHRSGHRFIGLQKGDRKYRKDVHRLVLETFYGACPEGMECLHWPDPCPSNNSSRNLRWGTRRQNIEDSLLQGLVKRGTKHHMAKLLESDVPLIHFMKGQAVCHREIARRFGVCEAVIQAVVDGMGWTHIKVSLPFSVLPAYRHVVIDLPPSRRESFVGRRFGRLTVVGQTKVVCSDGFRTVWMCNCDCGGSRLAFTRDLKSLRAKHCGCIKRGG